MPNKKNLAQVAALEEKFAKAKAIILTNYAGLNVKQQTKLRSELKKAGGEFIVAKNTLIARVLNKEPLNQSLQGQSAIVVSYDDEVSALKALVAFAKEAELPEIKEGVVADVILSQEKVMALSKLPGRQELLGMVLGRLNAPASNLVGVLSGVQRTLVYALEAIRKQKEAASTA